MSCPNYKIVFNDETKYVVQDITEEPVVRVIPARGEQGPQGPQGEQGPQGPQGEQGIQGEDGKNFEPTVVSELPETGDESKLYLTPKDIAKTIATGNSLSITTASWKDVLVAPAVILGDTFQQTYTGQNLYNVAQVSSGTYVTKDNDGWITITRDNTSGDTTVYTNVWTSNLALETSTVYKIFIEVKAVSGTGSLFITSTDSTQGQFSSWQEKKLADMVAGQTYTVTPTTKSSFSGITQGLRTVLEQTAGQGGSVTFRLSVCASSTPTDTFSYEPFVGGQASPNPDYPQPIKTVTGTQTVEIQGKNLICPKSRYDSDSHITVDYNSDSGEIHLSGTPTLGWSYLTAQNKSCSIPAGTYRLTTDSASNQYRKTVRFFHEGGSYTAASIQIGYTAATVTLTKTAIAYYIAVVYQDGYQAFELDDTFKLQLAAGSKSTEIEPFHNESISLPLGNINLRRVGDYADRIANINNAWVVERNTAIGTLTGIERWYPVDRDYFTRSNLGERPTSELQIISSKLLGLPRDNLSGNNYITMSGDGNIRVNIAGITSSKALASLLESNNIDYCYGLLAPEYEAIEDTTLLERLKLLEALHIDKGGTTTISVSATGVTGELQVAYYEVEPDDKYDKWIHIDGGYERIDADNGLVPTDGGYIVEGETNSSNAIWSQWSNRLAFGMDTATAPVPAQFNGQIFVDGTIIAHNTGNKSHNRWGFHVYEAYARDNYSRMTMLLNKHDNEFDGKKSFEAYYYTGASHKNSAYGFFKVGSDVKYHSFLFDRDKMIASGEIDCRFPVTLARINPSTDIDDTYQTVEAADTAYEAESNALENLKCLKYLALKNAQDGCMWYDTVRNKVVVKINGEWHDIDTTPVPSGTYNF